MPFVRPPIELGHAAQADAVQEARISKRRDERRPEPRIELAERVGLHVVVVIVTHEDDIDRRQLRDRLCRRSNPTRTKAPERSCVTREHGIREDRGPSGLDQECRMADERCRDAALRCTHRQRWHWTRRHGCRPLARHARAPPLEKVSRPTGLLAIDVEEPFTVAVVRYGVSHYLLRIVSAFGVRRSAFGVRFVRFGSVRFGVRRSAFQVRRSPFGAWAAIGLSETVAGREP